MTETRPAEIDGFVVVNGEAWLPTDWDAHRERLAERSQLTEPQLEALAAYCLTGRRKDAAAALHISEETLKNRVGAAFRKLGAGSALEAARKLGWLVIPAATAG